MKLVTSNQDLIVGRRYLCRTKPIEYQKGSFSKPELSILLVGEQEGRRYVGPNKFWAYDKNDGIVSNYAIAMKKEQAKAMSLPDSVIPITESDYEENSQALPIWDMIGPLPEIQEGILHNLFDYPALLKAFENPVSVHPNGDVALYIPEGIENCSDDGWYLISDKDSARELNAELEANIEIDTYVSKEPEMTQSAAKEKPTFSKEMLNDGKVQWKENGNGWKTVMLTETKFVSDGFYPKGTMFILGAWVEHLKGFDFMNSAGDVVLTGMNDGFEFDNNVDSSQPTSWSNLTRNPMHPQFPPNAFGQPSFENKYGNTSQAFQHLDVAVDISLDILRGLSAPNMGMFRQCGQRKTKEEKKQILELYLQYLSTQPY